MSRAPVLLFDGVCNLCDASVRFILAHEARPRLRFASLQSAAGQELLRRHGLPTEDFDTIWLVDGDRVYRRSAAAFAIARELRWPWRWLAAGAWLPRALTDWAYRQIASRRYRLFGRRDECRVPTPAERARFLG